MQNTYICCFTGHRDIHRDHIARLPELLNTLLEDLYSKGVKTFRAGGAMGFDTMAALAVLRLREAHPDVRLELCLPCHDQTKYWSLYNKMVYAKILRKCDDARYASEKFTTSCMFERNRMLVDGSHLCVAYYDGNGSGTGYTYSYAQKKGVKIKNLYTILENDA